MKPAAPESTWRNPALFLAVLFGAVLLVYSNHFQNGFHFDDAYAVSENGYIRSLSNLPRIWSDATAFSSLPSNRSYRPVVTTSLALDYRLGGGLNPFFFQLSTFLWYLLLLGLLFAVFRRIFDVAQPGPWSAPLAFFAVAWYGVHPVNAETVNYVIQRGEVLSTAGVVAGLYLFQRDGVFRRYHLYLIPVALGQLAKPPALVFPLLLGSYCVLFDGAGKSGKWTRAIRTSIPALLLSVAMAALQSAKTPATYNPGASSASGYLIAQPLAALRYFRNFFLPLWLSADTDHKPLDSIWSLQAWAGIIFIALMAAAIWRFSRNRELKPLAFGLFWFLAALLPTAAFPLAEVENDHRMFFPFVGLAIAVVWSFGLLLYRKPQLYRPAAAIGVFALAIYGWGAFARNRVWASDEALWLDVTMKSPLNGRGWMNYGLTQMVKGDYAAAREYFEHGLKLTPNYSLMEINLGIACGGMGDSAEAERHFQRAIRLAPRDAASHLYYGRWLTSVGRTQQAVFETRRAVDLNPDSQAAWGVLLQALAADRNWAELGIAARRYLEMVPGDSAALAYLNTASQPDPLLAIEQQKAAQNPTAENYLNLSLFYHRGGKYRECIEAARKAIQLRPDYAEAYNNIAAAYEGLRMWDEAIAAAKAALRINPGYQLAKNNLAWSQQQKALAASQNSRR